MRRLTRWLLPLITLLLIGAGAGMPWAAARMQDRYQIPAQEIRPLDTVSLTLQKESEIGSALRIMSDIYDYTDWMGETRMTEEEAWAAAFDVLVELDQYGLLEAGWMGDYGYIEPGILDRLKESGQFSAIPLLCITKDGASAVIWHCNNWEWNTCPTYTLLIDDATGMAVSGYLPMPYPEEPEAVYRRIELWRTFFQDYYGIEIPSVTENLYDAASTFIFPLELEDGLGPLALSVHLYDFETDFGPSTPWELELFGGTETANAAAGVLPDYEIEPN